MTFLCFWRKKTAPKEFSLTFDDVCEIAAKAADHAMEKRWKEMDKYLRVDATNALAVAMDTEAKFLALAECLGVEFAVGEHGEEPKAVITKPLAEAAQFEIITDMKIQSLAKQHRRHMTELKRLLNWPKGFD